MRTIISLNITLTNRNFHVLEFYSFIQVEEDTLILLHMDNETVQGHGQCLSHAGGAFGSACRTRLGGGDRRSAIGDGGGPCFRATEQYGDNQGAIYITVVAYIGRIRV